MKKNSVKIIFLFCLFISFLPLFSVLSQTKTEVEYPSIGGIKPEIVTEGLPQYVKYIFTFAVVASGLVILAALVWAGFIFLTAAGRPDRLKEGRDRIISAFLGIILLLSSYIIFVNINPQLMLFPLAPLVPIPEKPTPQLPPIKAEEINLIVNELPIGQAIESGVWSKTMRQEIQNLIKEDEDFLTSKKMDRDSSDMIGNITIETGGPTPDTSLKRIADLNKYLKKLTENCRCEQLKGLCTKPKDFAMPVGCAGDPCPENTRKKIDEAVIANVKIMDKLSDLSNKIIEKKISFEKELGIFQDIEGEMLACLEQKKSLFDLNEHLSRLNYFRELQWTVNTVKVPNAPPSNADPLTFYCSVGGNIFDYPFTIQKELPLELTVPELYPNALPNIESLRISCPVEIPVGEVIDQTRELAVSLAVKLKRLAFLHKQMASQIEKMDELVSQCNDKDCKMECKCLPNPCYQKCSPYTFWCCKSPCLQGIGGCQGVPCPRQEIEATVNEIKKTEDDTFKTIREIKQIFSRVASLVDDESNPRGLKNMGKGISLCYSSDVENPTWALLDCASAIDNYGPNDLIIGTCHPRNFFCCNVSGQKIQFPWQAQISKEPAVALLRQKFIPLPSTQGCPQGWLCDPDVKTYNQYNDASEPLKELLSCMRKDLDKMEKQNEITSVIGRISSISDKNLYSGACNWQAGAIKLGGCSHIYTIKYGKERVSAHYGGPFCRSEEKSYAVDMGDEVNADYIEKAAKDCRPDAYVGLEETHLHISIGQSEGCGGN